MCFLEFLFVENPVIKQSFFVLIWRWSLVHLLLQDQIWQHMNVCLCGMTLQHQGHRIVLTCKHLTELLAEAGCFLWTPVRCSQSSKLPMSGPFVSTLSPSNPTPFVWCIYGTPQCPVTEIQDLGLGAWRFEGRESSGNSSKWMVSWVWVPEKE